MLVVQLTDIHAYLCASQGFISVIVYYFRIIVPAGFNTVAMNNEEIREYCIAKLGVTEGFPLRQDVLVFKVI